MILGFGLQRCLTDSVLFAPSMLRTWTYCCVILDDWTDFYLKMNLYIYRALHPGTGRVLEVYSNQPGLQFYTGNLLPDPDKIVEVKLRQDESLS